MGDEDKIARLELKVAALEESVNSRFYITVLGIIVAIGLCAGVWFNSNWYDAHTLRLIETLAPHISDAPNDTPKSDAAKSDAKE